MCGPQQRGRWREAQAGGSLEEVMSGSSMLPTWLLTVIRPCPDGRRSAAAMRSAPSTLLRAPACKKSLQVPPTAAMTRC